MVYPGRVINLLRLDARKHGWRPVSADEAIAYGQSLSDEELLGISGFGPRALAWLRARPRTGITVPTDPDWVGKRRDALDKEGEPVAAADPIELPHQNSSDVGECDDPLAPYADHRRSAPAPVVFPPIEDEGPTPPS